MLAFTSDQWIIIALIFLLGLLVGGFLFAGSGRKWKTRYHAETKRREELEHSHKEREREWADREKDWRDQDARRGAALKDRDGPTRSDLDGDGVPDHADRRPTDDRKA